MSEAPFMPLWVSDFVGDTLDLDAKEIGAYMLLLMAMWTRDGTLPNDQKKLQRVARVGRDWPKIWSALERYFEASEGVITNKRLSQELHKVATKRRANAQSGARGGKAKALKYKQETLANATDSPKQPEPEPDIKDVDKSTSCPFPEFWKQWPNKVSKQAAERAWKKLSADDRRAATESAVSWFSQWQRLNPSLSPIHPATYLNNKRWQDQPQLSAINGGQDATSKTDRLRSIVTTAATGTSGKDWG